jgi:soluble lytic murein transglycosylase-like protein
MEMSRGKYDPLRHPARPLVMRPVKMNLKHWGVMAAMVIASNVATHFMFNSGSTAKASVLSASSFDFAETSSSEAFYLADKARNYVYDLDGFNSRSMEVADALGVPQEWLLAVIYQESQFNSGVRNFKGSGAVGLIQFMPGTAAELGTSSAQLQQMDPVRQLDYVYRYLALVRERYGDFQSLTDLYLGILYPKARGTDMCYTLYARPSQSYKQNSGLDENKDGRVTVSDVDRHLKRKYPKAYMVEL